AVRAKKLTDAELQAVLPDSVVQQGGDNGPLAVFQEPFPREEVAKVAAKLYGRGFSRGQIARALIEWLTAGQRNRTDEQRLQAARTKLRRWEMSKDFRDLVYEHALVELDMSTPDILVGL